MFKIKSQLIDYRNILLFPCLMATQCFCSQKCLFNNSVPIKILSLVYRLHCIIISMYPFQGWLNREVIWEVTLKLQLKPWGDGWADNWWALFWVACMFQTMAGWSSYRMLFPCWQSNVRAWFLPMEWKTKLNSMKTCHLILVIKLKNMIYRCWWKRSKSF